MNTLFAIAGKDVKLLVRDRQSVFWLLAFPLLYAVFFGSAFSGNGPAREIAVAIVDEAPEGRAADFIARLDASDAVAVEAFADVATATEAVRAGRKAAFVRVLDMPADGFGMFRGEAPRLEVGIDPSRQAEGGMLQGVLMEAAFAGLQQAFADPDAGREFARRSLDEIRAAEDMPAARRLVMSGFLRSLEAFFDQLDEVRAEDGAAAASPGLQPDVRFVDVARSRDRSFSSWELSFPQSIAWALLSCCAAFALTMVRERRDGTMTRLLTAPISRSTLLGGKFLACVACSATAALVLMAIGWLAFAIRIDSPLPLLAATLAAAFAFAGLMMMLSTFGETEAAASGVAWGVLLFSAMFGGGMIPKVFLADWMLAVGTVSPVRWAIEALEGATWRGQDWFQLAVPLGASLAIGGVCLAIGWLRLTRAAR